MFDCLNHHGYRKINIHEIYFCDTCKALGNLLTPTGEAVTVILILIVDETNLAKRERKRERERERG